jgi:hypothetical protein
LHHRAEEARTMAQGLKDQNTRRVMQGIVHAYDRLAQRADERGELADTGHNDNPSPLPSTAH